MVMLKPYVTRPALIVFGILFFLIPSLPASSADAGAALIQIAELLAHPEQYDRQDVVVSGKVMNVQLATNRQGQPAYGFLLQDAAGTLKVVSLGQAEVREGDQVIVEGTVEDRPLQLQSQNPVGRRLMYFVSPRTVTSAP